MHSPLVSWSRMVLLAGMVLALTLLVPAAWFPFQLGKVAVFATLLLITGVLFLVGRGGNDLLHAHGLKLALAVGALPLAYLISILISGAAVGVTGLSVEVDTLLFTALLYVAFVFSFGLFRTLRTVTLLTKVIFWALTAAVALQLVIVLFGLPFSVFADRSVNLIGKWNDFGLAAGLLGIFVLVQAELGRGSLLRRIMLGVGLVAIAFLLAVVNFSTVWWFILIASALIGLTAFLTQRTEERAMRESNPYGGSSLVQKIPWISLAGVVVSITFLLFGAGINTSLTNKVPVASLEVRPSFSSTYDVISKAREGSPAKALFGTGPQTFTNSWIANKPTEVNQSAFWNLDFSVGFSTLATALGTVGIVGALAWFVPFLLVLAGIIRAVRLSVLSREERVAALVVGLGSLYMLGALMLYVPSASIVLLGFVLAGAAFGFLWRQGRHSTQDEGFEPSPAMRLTAVGALAVLVLVSAWGAWSTDRRFIAQATTNQGAIALQSGNADNALALAQRSQDIEMTSDSLRLAVESGILKIQQLANDTTTPAAQLQQQFAGIASTTIATAQMLTKEYPNDYRSHLTLGRVYDLLASLKVEGAYPSAEAEYKTALALNPKAPDIALALARLEATHGNVELTKQYLSQSLTLKPNYTDAIMLVVQLNVANNDIPSAIQAAQAAAQTAPGVAPIWFQLGLLYYAGGDTKSAIPPLEQAIAIQSDYANARYFLALSYYTQGKTAEALKLFEDLAASNPDSQEVKLILNNLRSGKQPFDSAQPPITDKPAERPNAPLNQ